MKIKELLIILLCGCCILTTGCGDVEKINSVPPEELRAINAVLKQWKEGYELEDIDTYIGTFWEKGFYYVSDMGTDGDKTDDLEFDDIRDERESAEHVFEQFQDIEIELSVPPEIELNKEQNRAEVRNHYRIQGFVADGESLEGGYTGWFAEGDNIFIFGPVYVCSIHTGAVRTYSSRVEQSAHNGSVFCANQDRSILCQRSPIGRGIRFKPEPV